MSNIDLIEQMDLHLRAWQDSGVEWLPRAGGAMIIPENAPGQPNAAVPLFAKAMVQAPGQPNAAVPLFAKAMVQAPGQPTVVSPNPSDSSLFASGQIPLPTVRGDVGPPLLELPVLEDYQRERALKDLAYKVSQCKKCPDLVRARTQTVFGIGPLSPKLCIVGEAPGFNEDKQGEPFVGPAGELLTRMLLASGFKRDEVYICNILRCRPPENRPPLPEEAANCRSFLVQTLELVRPSHICLMGASATKYLLGRDEFIGQLRGQELWWRGIPVTATYHPSYLLRSPPKKHEAWADLQAMLIRMGQPLPEKNG